MSALPYCKYSNLRQGTWSAIAGTPVGDDYAIAQVGTFDPSAYVWIEETTIDLEVDLGAAVRVDGVLVVHANFAEGVDLRARLSATSGGAADATVTAVTPAWRGRWSQNQYLNFAALYPTVGDRTRRYLRFDNTDANGTAVKIGALVIVGQVDTIGVGLQINAIPTTQHDAAWVRAKRGPKTMHDPRTRSRRWDGQLTLDNADIAGWEALYDDTYGVIRPFVLWPENDLAEEGLLARMTDMAYAPVYALKHTTLKRKFARFGIEEVEFGEAH